MLRLTKKKFLRYVLLPNVCLFTLLAIYFPGAQLPIALTLASGIQGAALQAQIDNGLGEHITHLGIAKSFTVFAEWTEVVKN